MNIKTFIGGVLVGGVLAGAVTWVVTDKEAEAKLFANKERCASYVEKRQNEMREKSLLVETSIDVQGFYSPVANTCITNTQEIAGGHYIQHILIDELTGQREAFAFEALGQGFKDLSLEEQQEQVRQMQFFGERLSYFKGE